MSCARVLLVGGGITSAVTASLLAEAAPSLRLTVWDKARGAGGRMSTARGRTARTQVDTGAQYVSSTPDMYRAHGDIYAALLESGVLAPANTSAIHGMREERLAEGEATRHFVAPDGMSSLVKHFFKLSGAELNFGRRVAEVIKGEDVWRVRTECGLEDVFDAVVLTMPVPQLLALSGDVPQLISAAPGLREGLEKVSYSTRFVLGLYYDKTVELGGDWACKYIANHPIVRFISVDNLKRGKPDHPTSVLVHSTVPFGLANAHRAHEDVAPELLAAVRELVPALPHTEDRKSLKWLYSQVHRGLPGTPGSVTLSSSPALVVGGDAFTQSNFDGCVKSAKSITESVTNSVSQQQ